MATKQERKKKAIEIMKRMDIYKPYIQDFVENDTVCFYEEYIGFWAYQEQEVQNKIKEIEQKYNCTVYAVTHEYATFGECYDFLIVTNYKREWRTLVESENNTHYAFAYVWNKSDDWCSEFGTIQVRNFGGGIKRIG